MNLGRIVDDWSTFMDDAMVEGDVGYPVCKVWMSRERPSVAEMPVA